MNDKQSWNSAICLSKENLDQIAFWKRNLRTANLKEFTSDLSCHTIVYSDASNTGYDCYIDKSDPTKEAANLTDTLLNFSKLYSIKFIVLNTFKNLSSGLLKIGEAKGNKL
jgi:hypothetical protein